MAICNHIDEKVYLQKMYPIQQIAKTIKKIKEFANTVLWYFSLQKSYLEQQFAKTRDNIMSFQMFIEAINYKMSYVKHSDNTPKFIRILTFISSQLVLYLEIFKLDTLPQNQYI